MKIRVKSYLNITGLKRERIVATKEDITLKDFLIDLSNRYDKKIRELLFDPKGEQLKPYYLVLLNGKSCFAFPNQIHTKLNNGDSIVILPPTAGG